MAEETPTTTEQPLSPAPQRQPVIDIRTGLATRPWLMWFEKSWRRQGGPHAPANDELGDSLASTQAELDATQADLAQTQAALAATQAELATTQAELAATQAELAATEAALAQTQGDLDALEAEVDALEDELDATVPEGTPLTVARYQADGEGIETTPGLLTSADGKLGIGASPSAVAPLSFGTALGAKVSLYESGTSRYGWSVGSGTLEVHSASGGRVDVGAIATADGTTFTPHLSVMGATGNIGVGTQTFGTSAVRVLAIATGTRPTGAHPPGAVQVWAENVDGVAGQAGVHVRSEGGVLHRLGSGLLTRRMVQIVTTATVAAPLSLTGDDSHKVVVSNNATELAQFTLPSAVAGLTYTIVVNVVQGVRLRAAAGDLFRLGASTSPAGGQMQSVTAGDYAVLVAINATIWQVLSPVQGWTVGA